MHPYLSQRLKQTHATPRIVQDSTPILGFGEFLTARIATLGLNPSKREFLDTKGNLLFAPHARLESLRSLGLSTLTSASACDHQRILDGCLNYFKGPNAYAWFGRFAPILATVDASYKAGTACHLDLVQTVTDPVWSRLTVADRAHYIEYESRFFLQQLANHNIEKVLLNGRGVVNAFVAQTGVLLQSSNCTSSWGRPFEFFMGTVSVAERKIQVRGWNLNIQSNHGVTTTLVQSIAALC